MKKVLITGMNSYIGVNVENYLKQWPDRYYTEAIDIKGTDWKQKDFSAFDVVLHVAGIAHVKETKENAHLYYEVNGQLAVEVADKAKSEGVKHFIILSSMSVYGMTVGHITKDTVPHPMNYYGKAKYKADLKIKKMDNKTFKVAILRPPMVYGKGCKGNYQTLRKLALKSPIFPCFKNERSMLYIGNLATFIKELIDGEKGGLFFPQDAEYTCTYDMVKMIAEYNGRKIYITRIFNWGIEIMIGLGLRVFMKVFGSLTYEKVDLINSYSFKNAIKKTET